MAGSPDPAGSAYPDKIQLAFLPLCTTGIQAPTTTTVPLQDADGNPLFEIERILERKKSGNSFQYLIKWQGYPDEDNSWEPKANILGKAAKQMMQEIDRKSKLLAKPKDTGVTETTPTPDMEGPLRIPTVEEDLLAMMMDK